MLRGNGFGMAGRGCSGGGDKYPILGGLSVKPLLFVNLRSNTSTLRSLCTDRRFHISGRGGDDFELALELECIRF
jgi:hypothetical protein